MEPYNRFLSIGIKTGGYKKSEDGEFPATGGPPYICQEIGLVAFMFFFELLFSLCFFAISLYVPLTNLFSIVHFPYLLITRDTQDEGEARFRFY